jgi:hypothetical protein
MTQEGYGQKDPRRHDPPLLFQLDHDPGEQRDVAGAHADIVADLVRTAEAEQANVLRAPSQL